MVWLLSMWSLSFLVACLHSRSLNVGFLGPISVVGVDGGGVCGCEGALG